MQGVAFKDILEQLEANGDLFPGWKLADSLNRFEAMGASVFGSPNSQAAGNGNLWTAATSAYGDHDYVEDSMPVIPQAKRATSLAQLRKKLGHDLSIGELSSLRRKFAFENHPDRLPETERDTATSRLAIANDLIDLAIEKIGRKSAA